jgi:hypothetical protein
MKLTNFPSDIPTAHPTLPYKRANARPIRRPWKTSRKALPTKKGRFEAREGWSEAEPFLRQESM